MKAKTRKPEAPCKPGELTLWFDDSDNLWRYGTASEVDADGSVVSIEKATGGIVPRMVGSVVYVVRDDQLMESPSVITGALRRFGFLDLAEARVALLPYLDLSRKGTRDDLCSAGVIYRGEP